MKCYVFSVFEIKVYVKCAEIVLMLGGVLRMVGGVVFS